MANLETLMIEIGAKVDALTEVSAAGDQVVSEVESWGPKIGAAMLGIGAAGGAAFAVSLVGAMDQDAANDKLAAQLGLTEVESARAGAVAGALYSGAYGGSLGEVNDAVGAVVSSLPGMRNASDDALSGTTAQALDLASAFDTDVTSAVSSAGQLMQSGLATDATHAFDLIAAASQRVPASLRGDVLEASDEYAQFFDSLGYSGEEAFGLLVKGSEKGTFGIDKVGDAVKEFTIRSTDMSTASSAAYEAIGMDAETMANRILAGGDTAAGATGDIIDGLLGMTDPAAQASAAVALFGTPLEDLGVTEIPAFLSSLQGAESTLGDVSGTIDGLGDTLNGNAFTSLESFKRQVTQTFVDTVEGRALPAVESLAGYMSTNFGPGLDSAWAAIQRGTAFLDRNRTAVTVLATVFGVVLLPAVAAAVVGVVAGWASKTAAAVTGSAAQVAALYRTAAGWAVSAAAAVTSGAQTVAVWAMYRAQSVAAAGAVVAAHARMAAAWVAARAQSAASAAAAAAAWVASSARVAGALALQGAAFVASRAVMLAGAAATGIVTAAQWALNVALTANPIGIVIALIVALVAGLVIAYKNSETFRNIVNAAFRMLKNVVGSVVSWFSTAVPAAWERVTSIGSKASDALRSAASSAWSKIRSSVSAVASWLRQAPGAAFDAAEKAGAKASTALRSAASSAWSGIRSAINAVASWLRQAPGQAFNAVLQAFMRYTPLGIVISHWGQIKSFVSNAATNVKTSVTNGFNAAKTGASNAVSGLLEIARGIPGKVMSALSGMAGKFTSVGGDIVRGIANGISNGVGQITGAARRAAQAALDGAKNLLGINSPSKEAERQIGEMFGAGVAGGVLNSSSWITSAVESSLAPMLDPIRTPTVESSLVATGAGSSASATSSLDDSGAGRGHRELHVHVDAREHALRTYGRDLARDVVRELDLQDAAELIGEVA